MAKVKILYQRTESSLLQKLKMLDKKRCEKAIKKFQTKALAVTKA